MMVGKGGHMDTNLLRKKIIESIFAEQPLNFSEVGITSSVYYELGTELQEAGYLLNFKDSQISPKISEVSLAGMKFIGLMKKTDVVRIHKDLINQLESGLHPNLKKYGINQYQTLIEVEYLSNQRFIKGVSILRSGFGNSITEIIPLNFELTLRGMEYLE